MRTQQLLWAALGVFLFAIPANGQETITDVLNDRSLNMKLLPDRAKAVQRIKAIEDKKLKAAHARGRALGLPLREDTPSGGFRELVDFDHDGPVYISSKNVEAAITTGANLTWSSPHMLNGTGLIVGVWDGGISRATHQEFATGARLTNKETGTLSAHAMHVAGTIGAAGVNASARGMANAVQIHAYTNGNDKSEMTAAAATAPGQTATKIYVSNHSYGPDDGWRGSVWGGFGTDQNAYDTDFGKYNSNSNSIDSLVYSSPYLLSFWAAGNDGADNPSNGQTVTIGGQSVAYNSAIHPPGDALYRGGYETTNAENIGKNVVSVGAVNEAVTGGVRDPSKATLAWFSSTGPADDGRIKPDLVANGVSVFSTGIDSDTHYYSAQGTSMATPNASGSAALLVDQYHRLFSSAMRASTLKALLIHTADDRGNPGPDYKFGWGLMNVKKAADVIKRQADYPALQTIIEAQVSPGNASQTYTFAWDGVSPIQATLCWTDPAAPTQSNHDERNPDLINNLNLKLIAPNGTEYFPFVMPFVGTWTQASMSANAVTGVNNTDNVEQVLMQNPGQAGAWQAVVSYAGALTNNLQDYGLIITGAGVAGAVAFSPASFSVSENTGTATITVNRIGGSIGAASVNYATSNGTANAGSDYTATSGTLSWNDGESGPKTFNIPIINDGVSEQYSETVQVTLSNPIGIAISGPNPATLAIFDDETFMGITSFNNGGNYAYNTSQNITWASSLGGDVRIELLKNGLLYTTISDSTPNDGLFSWTIPTLAPTGNDYSIRITSLAGGGESDVSDGVFSILNVVNSAFYTADMSTDPGWTLQGLWAYGIPTGAAGIGGGQRDPTAGFTGSNVIGYNLAGPYENSLPERYATTPAIDCSGRSNVQLNFYRWLNVENNSWDNAKILVSNNGTSWTQIFANGSSNMTATSWSLQTINISAVADGQPTVYIRWVMGTTDGSVQYTGWNIDDVTLTGDASGTNPAGHLAFSSADFQVTENVGSATITVNRTLGTTGAVSVNYSTSNGTATSASDYTATSGTLNWADGDAAPKTFSIPITNDSIREDFLESLTLTLTNTVGATLAGTNPATLTIRDDDNNPPTVNAGQDKTVELSEVVPWNPSDTTTALWLDADDSDALTLNGNTVSVWEDKSGNNRNATASGTAQPTATANGLNNRRVLTFDGSTDVFQVNLDFLAGTSHSAFIVLADPTVYSNIYGAANGSAASNSLHVGFSSATNYRMNYWGHDYAPAITGNFVSTGSILNYVWPVGSPKQIFANGKLEGSGPNALAPGTMSGGGRIGKVVTHPYLGAKIAEIIICTGTVSAADRERFEGYLAHKWGLTANLAINHPYKIEPPGGTGMAAVVNLSDASVSDADGDSFTTGWSVVDGPAGWSFANTSAVNTSITFTQSGQYTLRLTATDGRDPASDDVVVNVGSASLALDIGSASIPENGGSSNATVTRSGITGDLVVSLNSSDTSEATVPTSVTIPNGQTTSPAFNIDAVNDSIVDGTQTVTITASCAGHTNGTGTLDVTDDAFTLTVVTGTGGSSTSGGGLKDPEASSHSISATAATGYQFTHWSVTSGSGTVDNPNAPNTFVWATSTTTVQANFQLRTYVVTYNGNTNTGGSAPANQTKTYGIDLPLSGPGSLVKTGYAFGGWNTVANGTGTSYPPDGTYTANADVTLYAQWTMLPYTLWASGTFAALFTDTAATSNPDGDAFINLQEFAFGMDPTSPVSGPLVYVSEGNVVSAGPPILQNFAADGQSADFRMVFPRRKNHVEAGLAYTVQFSADLSLWAVSETNPTLLTGVGSSGDMEAVSVPFPATVDLDAGGSAPPRFVRVMVSLEP